MSAMIYSPLIWFQWLCDWWSPTSRPPAIGRVRFGSLRRVRPIGPVFGLQRGHDLEQCIDRYYIRAFLTRHADDIHGHVLEVADTLYTQRFGGTRVAHADILHAPPGHPEATIVADLTDADHVPSNTFDCIILTQTLQYIYEVRQAIQTLYRVLRPGGVLLVTCPGISQMSPNDRTQWGEYWRFTSMSLTRLLTACFPADQVQVQAYGNVLTAIGFLHGLLLSELPPGALMYHDPDYELLITGRAVKP